RDAPQRILVEVAWLPRMGGGAARAGAADRAKSWDVTARIGIGHSTNAGGRRAAYADCSGVASDCRVPPTAPCGANDPGSSARRLTRPSLGRSGTAMGRLAPPARWKGGTRA